MNLGFNTPGMQATLLRLLEAAAISYDTRDGSVYVPPRYEDALMSLFDAVRDVRFEAWHSFRPLDPTNSDAYRVYMRDNAILYEEEIQNGVTWFLVEHGSHQYDWGIEKFARP